MLRVNFRYNKTIASISLHPAAPINEIFNQIKGDLGIEADNSEFLLWHSRPVPIDGMPIGALQIEPSQAIVVIIEKNNYEKLDRFLNTIAPSIVCDSATYPPKAQSIIHAIQTSHQMICNFSQEDIQSAVLSIIPFDRIDGLEGDAQVAEITKWFKEDFFVFVKEIKCHLCNGETIAHNSSAPVTREEFSHQARNCELYKCKACGAMTRFPRYNDVSKLIETRIGRCGEFHNTFGAILKALGYDVRLVNDMNDHVWVEFWSEEKQRYVHVDPCENIIDAPYTYEKGWGKKIQWVFAVSENQCQDVTKKYTQKFSEVSNDRINQVTDEWYYKYIRFKNEEYLVSFGGEERAEIINKQKKDAEYMESTRGETLPEEERNRISGNE